MIKLPLNIRPNRMLGLLLLLGILLISYDHLVMIQGRKTNKVVGSAEESKAVTTSSLGWSMGGNWYKSKGKEPQINVFYNLYTSNEGEVERVREIVAEQLSYLLPEEHKNVWVTSLGYPQNDILNATIVQRFSEGDEDMTLHFLWEYCRSNPYHDEKVVYLHSKGSFHNTKENKLLRKFVTSSALSKECAHLPDQCNVCSSRMSPLPHVHTSGNMWLARCDYIAKLFDPQIELEGKLKDVARYGRFFNEHWVHLHPEMRACDVYDDPKFTWGHSNVPEGDFEKDLQMAPRFDFDVYTLPFPNPAPKPREKFVYDLLHEYSMFYGLQPDESWWAWDFYNTTLFQWLSEHHGSFDWK